MSADVLNHEIWVSFGGDNGKARGSVKGQKLSIRRLTEKLSKPSEDNSVTYAQYMKLPGDEKGARKAAPGFIILGKFKDGRRKISHQIGRSGIQIDIDYATPEQVKYILDGDARLNQFCYIWHTTRAHCQNKPRIRIIVPLNKMIDADQANALTRLLSLYLAEDPEEAIEIPDLVSFRFNQIMYLPSISMGQEFKKGLHEAPILNVDEFLEEHPEWADFTKLPRQERETSAEGQSRSTKMEDPTQKDGIVGAFCRAYSVEEAIAEFIPDVYIPGDSSTEIRYTYAYGSGGTSNGAIVYDDGLFLHSHHGSDPAEGLHNAFDLVRLHRFGDKDDAAPGNTSPGNMPSFKEMTKLAMADERVKKARTASLSFDDDEFEDYEDDDEVEEQPRRHTGPGSSSRDREIDDLLGGDDDDDLLGGDPEVDDLLGDPEPEAEVKPREKKRKKTESKWQERLVLDKADQPEKTRFNASLIIQNDRRIAPTIALNELTGTPYVKAHLRFPDVPEAHQAKLDDKVVGRRWTDVDTAALTVCLSAPPSAKGYGRDFAQNDVEAAMLLAAEMNRYNPVLDTIHQTKWDGVRRLGTIFHRFLGAPDTAYIRELEFLWFVASICRLYEPGHEFHLVPILGGKQGGGKTGFIKQLGFDSKFYGELSGDFGNTQKMVESTRGKWILEVPELKGFHRHMIQDIKQYFTAQKDTVRLAYRRNEEDFYRRCNFMGTTNEGEYLRDDENRRFCPVPTTISEDNVLDFATFIPLVPQIWAEAEVCYLEMRKKQPEGMLPLTFWTKEAKAEAKRRQTEARETLIHEPVMEVLEEWLNARISASAIEARDNLVDEFDGDGGQMFVRNLVTVTMIREELASNPIIRDIQNKDKVIGMALKSMDGWVPLGFVRRLGKRARFYARVGFEDAGEFVPASGVLADEEGQDRLLAASVDDLLS